MTDPDALCTCKADEHCASCQKCDKPGHKRFRGSPPKLFGNWCDECFVVVNRSPIWPMVLLVPLILLAIVLNTIYAPIPKLLKHFAEPPSFNSP